MHVPRGIGLFALPYPVDKFSCCSCFLSFLPNFLDSFSFSGLCYGASSVLLLLLLCFALCDLVGLAAWPGRGTAG